MQDSARNGRWKTALAEDNLTIIAGSVFQIPKDSISKRSAEFDISCNSVHRIMKSLKPKPYRPQLYQGLLEDDFNVLSFQNVMEYAMRLTTTFTMHSLGG